MTKDDARATIYATAKCLRVGEEWKVSRGIYRDAFMPHDKFSHPDFELIDRTSFYIIRRIKA